MGYTVYITFDSPEFTGQAMLSESRTREGRLFSYNASAEFYEKQAVEGHANGCRCIPCRRAGDAKAYRKLIELEEAGAPILHPEAGMNPEVQPETADPFNGVGFEYNGATYGMCARDGGVEVLRNGKIIYASYVDGEGPTTREKDALAKGDDPKAAPPGPDERCPRCHSKKGAKPERCELCNPREER